MISGYKVGSIFLNFEIIFTYSAKRANPIIWNIFKCCTWSDTALWVTYFWVINPATNITYIFFHNAFVFDVNTVS